MQWTYGCALVGTGFILLLNVSCSSFKSKGEDFFEQGAYEDAVANYERAVAEDPNDAEAVAGLRKSREKLIDTKLLEVRKSRLAGNPQSGLDMLLQLVERESKWNFYPMGAVASTQQEETKEALAFLRLRVSQALAKQLALQAHWLVKVYGLIFQGKAQQFLSAESDKTRRQGRQQCSRFQKAALPSLPYFTAFVEKFCAEFNLAFSSASAEASRLSELSGKLKLTSQVQGLGPGQLAYFRQALEQSFFETPWYDPKSSRAVRVTLSGQYSYTHDQTPERRVHQYYVQVPYTVYERVRRTKQVPYETHEYRCDSYGVRDPGQPCQYVPVTRFKTDEYYDTVPTTKYRSESRSQEYTGVSHLQKMDLAVDGLFILAGNRRTISLSDRKEDRGFEHTWDMPDIGLTPKSSSLTDPDRWLEARANDLSVQLRTQSVNLWRDLYCKPGKEGSMAETGNQAHKCLRLDLDRPPPFAEQWYQTHFGLSVAEARMILDLSDL